jgi:hypothetical protein
MDQLRLSFAIQTATLRTFSGETSGESHFQAPLDKPLFDANYRAATDRERLGNLPISEAWFTLALITHEKGTGHKIVPGWGSAGMYHCLQKFSLRITQAHGIAVVIDAHTFVPLPGKSRHRVLSAMGNAP